MARKTYLELVNEVLDECKLTLDPLTSATFAVPTKTAMYNRVKRWVNRAYQDIVDERHERFFRVSRATVTVYPRLLLTGLTYTPSVGDVLYGDTSGVKFTVVSLHADEPTADPTLVLTSTTVSVTYDEAYDPATLVLGETVHRLTPTAALGVAKVGGRGRYSFEDLVPTLDQIDIGSITIQPSITLDDDYAASELQGIGGMNFWPWSRWSLSPYDSFAQGLGRPAIITRASNGLYDFYPRPDKAYDIQFDYSKKYVNMVLYSDTPSLVPEKSEDLIIWKAVKYYADWDGGQARLWASANKNDIKGTYILDRDYLAAIGVNLGLFDC